MTVELGDKVWCGDGDWTPVSSGCQRVETSLGVIPEV